MMMTYDPDVPWPGLGEPGLASRKRYRATALEMVNVSSMPAPSSNLQSLVFPKIRCRNPHANIGTVHR